MKRNRPCLTWFLLLCLLIGLLLTAAVVFLSRLAVQAFGAPVPGLNAWQRYSYGVDLVFHAHDLTQPRDPAGKEQSFVIQSGETVPQISQRLEKAGLIRLAQTFRIYLLWTGMDKYIQTGTFLLSPARSGREIAAMLKSTSLIEVTFNILPGWREEEIAASLPTSGLKISPQEFLALVAAPPNAPPYFPATAGAEGFLFPASYTIVRTASVEQLVSLFLQGFSAGLTPELQKGFSDHGLSVYQAVTLASIVQREAVVEDEMPMIASVFYNRLARNMPLQSDPTVQYALGLDTAHSTWWKTPLSAQDLEFISPYNTYLHPGLPPGPICNPGLAALQAVASPAESNFLYFQARCDKSGRHAFAETLEQHHQNDCP